IVEGPPGPVGGPADEVVIDGPPAREVVRQGPPGAAVAVTVEDRIEDVPEVGLAGPPQVRGGREQRLEDVPLGIGQVTRIGFGSHLLSTYESALWNRLLHHSSITGPPGGTSTRAMGGSVSTRRHGHA